ncbi:ATP-binding protein [Janthinobacterium sp.]|uniref:ATP-binding protein n=1 Tax=Janthinobacterium sp. TaxID=1871054 RepID=UPI00293D3CF6|nr:ATP-binding protein [Janthinobacterium sp.]
MSRLWPRSLFGRLTLILVCGLLLAHGLSFGLILYQQAQASKMSMLYALGKDVASSVAILERLPPSERPAWLDKLERRNYRFLLGPVPEGAPLRAPLVNEVMESVQGALDAAYSVTTTAGPDPRQKRIDIHLKLSDGTPLTIALRPAPMPLAAWLVPIFLIQLVVLILFMWWAVRLATRPLAQLAAAADRMGPAAPPLPEHGPLEVALAAVAFNAMQRRIAEFLAERMQILAAVSHDLRTPITRMRLRADLLDDPLLRDKMLGDLRAMQMLVEEGIAYARDAKGLTELPCRTNLDALLASLVYDYTDECHELRLRGRLELSLNIRPHALRRIVTNLVDNALKFGTEVEIELSREDDQHYVIAVLDRGPGIDPAEWKAVFQPFYRIDNARSRDTGGTGLGLAIAQQLTSALGGSLSLAQRAGGGLAVRLSLPRPTTRASPPRTDSPTVQARP